MKLLSIFFLVGLAVATAEVSLVDRAKPLLDVIQELPANLQRARTGQTLGEALGLPHSAELDGLETKIRNEIGDRIREILENVLKNLEEFGSNAHAALKELLEKLLGGTPTKEDAKEFISLVSELENNRDSVGKLVDAGLDSQTVGAVAWYSIEERGIAEWWEKVKAWFSGLGSWISDKAGAFKNWAKDVFHKVIDASKPITGQIKDLAVEFLKNNWDTGSVELVKQALNFFYPHSGDIGAAVMKQLIEVARKLGLTQWENTYLLY